jgi:hypothetical protein
LTSRHGRSQSDLIGGPVFWLAATVTLVALLVSAALPRVRAWVGVSVLMMWSAFSTLNAYRARRIHSLISAPVYLVAALALAGFTSGLIGVPVWFIWVLGAGLIAANLTERVRGRYF